MRRASISDTKRFTRKLKVEGLEARCVLAAAVELPGDWDGQSFSTIAIYDADDGTFTVPADDDAGTPETTYRFGPRNSKMTPFFGDWDGDGTPTAGLYSRATGKFFLKNDINTISADVVFKYGPQDKQWSPFAGDWDGDGSDGVGLYEPGTGKFFLRNETSTGKADSKFKFGTVDPNWRPVSGDWNEDGSDNVGVWDADSSESLLRDGDALPETPSSVITFETLSLIWRPITPMSEPDVGTVTPLEFEEVQADLGESPLITLTESSEDVVPEDGEPFPPAFTIDLTEAEVASLLALIDEQEAQALDAAVDTTEADEPSEPTEETDDEDTLSAESILQELVGDVVDEELVVVEDIIDEELPVKELDTIDGTESELVELIEAELETVVDIEPVKDDEQTVE